MGVYAASFDKSVITGQEDSNEET